MAGHLSALARPLLAEATHVIRTAWNGVALAEKDHVHLKIEASQSGGVGVVVDAPLYNSPAAPAGPAGEPFQGLWDYEGIF
jgi:hypothetical protein